MLSSKIEGLLKHDVNVALVNDVWVRLPYNNASGFSIFFEPLICAGPLKTNQVESILDLKRSISPLRTITEDGTGNACFEYADIELEHWPDIRIIKDQNNYNRVKRDALSFEFSIKSATKSEINAAIDTLIAKNDYVDLSVLLNYAINYNDIEFEWLALKSGGTTFATFLTRQNKISSHSHTFFSYIVILSPEVKASIATWHLINYAKHQGCTHFDLWNVALNARENYKKCFFTKLSWHSCWYFGYNPYTWLKVYEQDFVWPSNTTPKLALVKT